MKRLEQFLSQQETLQDYFAALIECSNDAVISEDLSGVIRSWNPAAERMFGYTADEAVGQHISLLVVPDRAEDVPNILGRIARGERVDQYETVRQTKDGRHLFISLTVSPIRDKSGRIIGGSKIARDITAQRQSEEALRKANELLVRANADLEHFAYSASHDLQEPLRMVSAFSEMLKKNFSGQLGVNGEEYIGYILTGALRMQQLLHDLRTFTQTSTITKSVPQTVDANKVLGSALENLKATIEASGAVIVRDPLPWVAMHEFELQQLFQNLIGNAIRYHSNQPPRIHITAQQSSSHVTFSVEDNGIGIEPQYKEYIFGIFKRLHTSAEYPGTGMGLAICQRVVERVGGRIWVESEFGRGSTFFFSVPISTNPKP